MSESIQYNQEFQKLLLNFLISDQTLYALSRTIIKPEYWDREFRKAVSYIISYTDKYGSIPTPEILYPETNIKLSPITVDSHLSDWFLDNIENFCKHKAMERLILDGPELLEKGQYAEIEERSKKNVMISLQKDLGTDYFENPKERLESLKDKKNMVSTGWKTVDEKLYGGFNKGEITFFAGGPGCVTGDTMVKIIRLRSRK